MINIEKYWNLKTMINYVKGKLIGCKVNNQKLGCLKKLLQELYDLEILK